MFSHDEQRACHSTRKYFGRMSRSRTSPNNAFENMLIVGSTSAMFSKQTHFLQSYEKKVARSDNSSKNASHIRDGAVAVLKELPRSNRAWEWSLIATCNRSHTGTTRFSAERWRWCFVFFFVDSRLSEGKLLMQIKAAIVDSKLSKIFENSFYDFI